MTRISEDAGISYRVISSRRKSICVEVQANGDVVVRAPKWMSRQQIRDFVYEKRDWILRKVRIARAREHQEPLKLQEGEKLPFLGEELTLRIGQGSRISKKGTELFLPADVTAEKLVNWLKRQARVYFQSRLDEYAQRMGLFYESMRISRARGRWGSCSEDRHINFSWHLILCDREAIDYVVVHELCHLIHMDHSPAFWAEVEKVLPDYRTQRKWLKDHAELMELL